MAKKNSRGLVLGIDPSLTKTGVVALDVASGEIINNTLLDATKIDRLSPFKRAWCQIGALSTFISALPEKPGLVGMEDFGFIQNNRAMFETGELVGAMKLFLFKKCIPILFTLSVKRKKGKEFRNILMIGPSQTKKYALGQVPRGQGKGNRVPLAVYKEWKVEFDSDDEADAYVIARITRNVWEYAMSKRTGYSLVGAGSEDLWEETAVHLARRQIINPLIKNMIIVETPGKEFRYGPRS